jgi:hypothetical protein
VFFDEWSDFLDQVVVTPDELIITGDLNFHLDDTNDGDARKFIQSLEDHGFIQNVTGPTHKHGHTLDVLITRENSSILLGQPITHDPTLFDQKGISTCHHLAISSRLQLSKHPKKREKVTFRKFRDISKRVGSCVIGCPSKIELFSLVIKTSSVWPCLCVGPVTFWINP